MTLRFGDRIQETLAAPGTSSFVLGTPTPAFHPFSAIPSVAVGDTIYYTAVDSFANWEVGLGTYATGTLARTTVLVTSAGGTSPINFTNPIQLGNTLPVEYLSQLLISSNVAVQLGYSATQNISAVALFTYYLPGTGSAVTLTLQPGTYSGQVVRVYTSPFAPITVQSNVTSGNPSFDMADGSTVYSIVFPTTTGYSGGADFYWDGTVWHVNTFGQPVIAPAANANQAITLGQANTVLSFSGSATVTPTNAPKTTVLMSNAAAATVTVSAGVLTGQQIVIKGCNAAAVTVALSNGSGNPVMYFPDGVTAYSTILALSFAAELSLIWDGTNWRVTNRGRTIVAPANAANQAPQWAQVLAGNGLNWSNQTPNRTLGTTYTNSQGRPLMVNWWGSNSTNSAGFVATVNGVVIANPNNVTVNQNLFVSFIVPIGATYSINWQAGTANAFAWYEL